MIFGKGYYKTFEAGIEREWVITNGIGGYCGSTIIGASARKHHGYLVASLHPPVERFVMLNKTDETIEIGDKVYSFATNQRPGGWNDQGQKYLQRFIYDELPHFVYQVEGTFITKTLCFEWEKNTIAIGYDIVNGGKEAKFRIKPFFTYRDHHHRVERANLKFNMDIVNGTMLTLQPEANKDVIIKFNISEGSFEKNQEQFDSDMELQTEINTGGEAIENSFTPYDAVINIAPFQHKKISIICSIEEVFEKDAFATIDKGTKRIKNLVENANIKSLGDDFANSLVQAADQFIVRRESTGNKTIMAGYPWFTDWGRDTMIALQGLTLITNRYEDARGILKSFAMYVKNGLVPNMFPDEGLEPLYNTADASLWYFYSVDKYLEYTGGEEDYNFIKEEIYEKLEEIIHFYSTKTDFSIYMEEDGLIHAGGGYDQVTWMDVRVGTWVVTPRHGKPVEINALWYNALKVMEKLSKRFGIKNKEYGKSSKEYSLMAEKAKDSFNKEFWNDLDMCLYDVVENQVGDRSIRPNQIYAVSLPYTMLNEEKEKLVVEKVISELYATYGLRTLNKDNKEYKPYYKGKLHDRDGAYHQGTAWAFPLGALITAYVKVSGSTTESKEYARKLIEPLYDHLMDGCVGSIAEIFDGNEPNISRGAYAQAWSVGEILRAYVEDVL